MPGKVKTRLAETVGHMQAAHIYAALCALTHTAVAGLNVRHHIYYSDFIEQGDIWEELSPLKHRQLGKTLGHRMAGAIGEVLGGSQTGVQPQSEMRKCVLIGTDCPYLSPDILHAAFEALNKADVVIGPAKDGGYYLIGMRQLHPALFALPAWSTSHVFQDTLDRIIGLGLHYALLTELEDIDIIEDWTRYLQFKALI